MVTIFYILKHNKLVIFLTLQLLPIVCLIILFLQKGTYIYKKNIHSLHSDDSWATSKMHVGREKFHTFVGGVLAMHLCITLKTGTGIALELDHR